MSKPKIYELSKEQNDAMGSLANGKSPIKIAVEPNPEDDQETKDRLTKVLGQCDDLVKLGFIKDITNKYAEDVAISKLKTGRGIKMFLITDVGYDMFHGPKNPTIH